MSIKTRLHERKERGFSLRCKPLVTVKNKKSRVDFARTILKQPTQFWKKIIWADETKINLYRNLGLYRKMSVIKIHRGGV